MNRIERLTAILLLLQGKKRTAREIAEHFELSRRTIQRDLDALGEMGIPIVAELGTTGGYSLPPDYSLPPLALSLHEALLLRLALSSLSQLSQTPFETERESLLAKVQTLLPQREREDLDQLTQTLSLNVPSHPFPTPFLERLLESARSERWLTVTYRSEQGVSQQTLLPQRVRTEAGLWYCEAFSSERQSLRVYRVDRFLEVRAALEPPQAGAPASKIVHVNPAFPEVILHLTARGVLKLDREPYLASRLLRQEDGTATLKMHLRPAEYDWLVRILLGLGTDARVLAPEALRARIQQAAQELVDHYRS